MAKKLYEESSVRAIANAIRAKNGSTDTYKIAEMPAAISAIETGGAVEGDTREVYQGTRPAEWLRLPDYNKIADRTVYCLVQLYPDGTNIVAFDFRCDGNCTMTAGKVVNGEFVPFSDDEPVVVAGSATDYATIERTFDYEDYDDLMSDGTKQIIIKLDTSGTWHRLRAQATSDYRVNGGILDMIVRREGSVNPIEPYSFCNCLYFYNFTNDIPAAFPSAIYVKTNSGVCSPTQRLYAEKLRSFLGTVKMSYWQETFRGCTSLEELTCDISDITSWTNPFYGNDPCRSLRKLLFVGGESLTSFPGDINLTSTALEADAVLAFFNTLPDISASGTARTITLKSTPAATAGIPDETLAVATDKGWTVVTA